jgi:hypothetical protein
MSPTTDSTKPDGAAELENENENEGEGSRTATRRYDEGAEKAAGDLKHVTEAAEKALKALEGAEGDALREAEKRAKKSHSS